MIQHVFIVSDGTGGTAKQALKAALVQFELVNVQTHLRQNIRTEQQLLKVVLEAHKINAVIIHTLVSKNLRHFILEKGLLYELVTIDIMGPLLAQLSLQFENSPSENPGIFHTLNKAYFKRIEAVEFSLKHDDGQRVYDLDKADIILLGVSRTFKTPVSVYMAHKGWRVANIPIILGMQLPEEVLKLPPERIFCLTTYPKRLAALREIRNLHLGGLAGSYSNKTHVARELNYALRIYRMHPKWTIINVTHKPIEEISSEILSILRNNKPVKN